ncbi:hypothetical protein ACP4OV_007451 [Aristida adscensionis]
MSSAASCLGLLLLAALASSAAAQLSSTFYEKSCPNVLSTIKSAVTAAVRSEPRIGASLLRLHFHDCFVQGCDASILLAGNEQLAGPNQSLNPRGYAVIDNIKSQVEAVCKQTVSCADILAVAARDAVVAVRSMTNSIALNHLAMHLGGPSWTVQLGRRDSPAAASSTADLPSPLSSLPQLISVFQRKGLDPTDMVALSGAHSIGRAQCASFRAHIYNDKNVNPAFAAARRASCPAAPGNGDGNLAPLDTTTADAFDSAYYRNLMAQKGLLHSDQELFNGGSADGTVRSFASNPVAFRAAFAAAMVKMGNIGLLTGTQGQIRLTCSKAN